MPRVSEDTSLNRWLVSRGARRVRHSGRLWTIATVAVIGCTGDTDDVDQGEVHAAVWDSTGVLITENSDAVDEVRMWTVREQPILTIGQDLRSAREYQFELIHDLVGLPDGGVLVADHGDKTIRAYRENGSYGGTWGREGQGPGEFTFLGGMDRLGADSVAVWDRRSLRLTVYDMVGNVGRTSRAFDAPEVILIGIAGANRLVFERVQVLEFTDSEFRETLAGRGDSRAYQRLQASVEIRDATGDLVAVIGPYASVEHHFPTGTVRYFGSVRFSRRLITGVWDDLVIAGPNDTYELRAHGLDGRLRRVIRWDRPPIPTDDGHRSAFAEENPIGSEDVPMASHLPMFDTVLGDALGYLWVRDYDMPGQDTVRWTVFDPQGDIAAQLTTSDRLRIREIGQDYILASQTDDLDVHSVVLLSLDRG